MKITRTTYTFDAPSFAIIRVGFYFTIGVILAVSVSLFLTRVFTWLIGLL